MQLKITDLHNCAIPKLRKTQEFLSLLPLCQFGGPSAELLMTVTHVKGHPCTIPEQPAMQEIPVQHV